MHEPEAKLGATQHYFRLLKGKRREVLLPAMLGEIRSCSQGATRVLMFQNWRPGLRAESP